MSCHEIDPIKRCSFVRAFERIVISIQQREHEIPDVLAFARGLIFQSCHLWNKRAWRHWSWEDSRNICRSLNKKYGSNPTRYPMQSNIIWSGKNIGKIFSRTLIWLWRYVMTVWIHNVLVSTLNCAWNCTVALNIVRIVNASRISITNQAIWLTSSEVMVSKLYLSKRKIDMKDKLIFWK